MFSRMAKPKTTRAKTPRKRPAARRAPPLLRGGAVRGSDFLGTLAGTLERINEHLARRKGDVKSIMIVEDDDDARDILASVLEHAGYATVCVSSGKDALAKLKKVIPSLIILDLQMPEMTGWMVDRSLKADPKLRRIPVVITSAFADLQSSRTGMAAEAWFQKPIDLAALLETLPQLLVKSGLAVPK